MDELEEIKNIPTFIKLMDLYNDNTITRET